MEKVMKKMLRVLVALMPLLVFSCSDEENIVENASASIRWIRPEVEFRAVSASPAQGQRRVALKDEGVGKGLSTHWNKEDRIGVWNVTAQEESYDMVHPSADAKSVDFLGKVHCKPGDRITVFYPFPSPTAVFNKGTLTLDLSRQKGTLDFLAENCDLVFASSEVRSANEKKVDARLGTFKCGVTYFQFGFKDENGEPLKVKRMTLKVAGAKSKATLDLATHDITPVAAATDLFEINLDTPSESVYFATFADVSGLRFQLEVVDELGIAHKVSAKAPQLGTGQLTRATALKAHTGDYIEIDDIKWAKGNLMWHNGLVQNNFYRAAYDFSIEHYFIAPQQYWAPELLGHKNIKDVPMWPQMPPASVPNGTTADGYYSKFTVTSAALHGEISGRGRVPNKLTAPTSARFCYTKGSFAGGLEFHQRIWRDEHMRHEVSLEEVLNKKYTPANGGLEQKDTYYGDLAYVATKGKYRLPKVSELEQLFTSKSCHRVWGVYLVPLNNLPVNMMHGSFHKANGTTYIPVYGMFVCKSQKIIDDMRDKRGLLNRSYILSDYELTKGIFLPAEGERGWNDFVYDAGRQPGVSCAYASSTIFSGGGLFYRNMDGWYATSDPCNYGGAYTSRSRSTNVKAMSIRPVYIANPLSKQ